MFVVALLVIGGLAVAMSLFTLADPLADQPHLAGRFDAALVRDIFGWMMLHVGLLTICLT